MRNVLEFIVNGCPKKMRNKFMKSLFSKDDEVVEFDIKSDELMRVLQKETEVQLTGKGVYVEMYFYNGFRGFSLYGNFEEEAEDEEGYDEGDFMMQTNRNGEITDVDLGY